jgi:hypothetical protein
LRQWVRSKEYVVDMRRLGAVPGPLLGWFVRWKKVGKNRRKTEKIF